MTHSSQQSHASTAASSTAHLPATSQTQTSPSAAAPSPLAPPSSTTQDQSSVSASSPSLTHPSLTSPILSSAASISQQPDGSTYSAQDSPALSEAVPTKSQPPASPQKVASVPKGKLNSSGIVFTSGNLVRSITPSPKGRYVASSDPTSQWQLSTSCNTTCSRPLATTAAGSTNPSRSKNKVPTAEYDAESAYVPSWSESGTERTATATACHWKPTSSVVCTAATNPDLGLLGVPWLAAGPRGVV